MHSTNTDHIAIDLVDHGVVKNTKNLNISRAEHDFSRKQKNS